MTSPRRAYKPSVPPLLAAINISLLFAAAGLFGYTISIFIWGMIMKNREEVHAAIVLILNTPRKRYLHSELADDILDAIWSEDHPQDEVPQVREEDLKVDYFHVSGDPVNHGPRGVTLTHVPTGMVVNKWAERSQLENTSRALKELRLRLEEE